ncbi:unnamed protein product [Cochlearia groenlandica]
MALSVLLFETSPPSLPSDPVTAIVTQSTPDSSARLSLQPPDPPEPPDPPDPQDLLCDTDVLMVCEDVWCILVLKIHRRKARFAQYNIYLSSLVTARDPTMTATMIQFGINTIDLALLSVGQERSISISSSLKERLLPSTSLFLRGDLLSESNPNETSTIITVLFHIWVCTRPIEATELIPMRTEVLISGLKSHSMMTILELDEEAEAIFEPCTSLFENFSNGLSSLSLIEFLSLVYVVCLSIVLTVRHRACPVMNFVSF